jgi:hypothetical protein
VLVPFVPPIFAGVKDGQVQLAPPPGLFDDDALQAGNAPGPAAPAPASKRPPKKVLGEGA